MIDLEILIPTSDATDDAALARCLLALEANTKTIRWMVSEVQDLLAAIASADSQYLAIVPPTHELEDPSWFGKMQMPFLRTPSCGLTIASDQPGVTSTGMQPFQWPDRRDVPGKVVFSPLERLRSIAVALPAGSHQAARVHEDHAQALFLAARSLGLDTWIVPTVRLTIAGAESPR